MTLSDRPSDMAVISTIETPVPVVVEAFEKLLERAKSGEIIAFAMAMIVHGGGTASQFSNGDEAKLLGAVRYLEHRILKRWDENE